MDLSLIEWDSYFVVNILSSWPGFRWAIQGPMSPLVYHNIQFSRETEKSSLFLEQLYMKIYSLIINMTKHNLIEYTAQV